MATAIILPPPALAPFNPSRLVMKLMSALPVLCKYGEVEVHDLSSVDQWRALGNSCLLKVGLAKHDGPKKEVYNVTAIWLRMIATTHQEDPACVTMLVQQWFNLFGRWPVTIAFFATCAPTGDEPGASEVPEGLRGDVYEAAMWFKAYLTDLAKIHYALPMVPVFWEDNFALRVALSRVMRSGTAIPQHLADNAAHALESRTASTMKHAPSELASTEVQALQNLSIGEPSSPVGSGRSSTPRGNTDTSDVSDVESSNVDDGAAKPADEGSSAAPARDVPETSAA